MPNADNAEGRADEESLLGMARVREAQGRTLAGGPDGPLTGTVKTTAKGEAQKLKVDVTFSASFAKPSAAKK